MTNASSGEAGQNLYVDTRGCCEAPVPFTEAVVNGLAQGGGLYVPEHIPTLTLKEITALAKLPYAQRAAAIYKAFAIDLPDDEIDRLMARSYGDNFDDDAICPITSLDDDTHVRQRKRPARVRTARPRVPHPGRHLRRYGEGST